MCDVPYCLLQVPVVQKVDNVISIQTKHYPMDSAINYPNKYPLNLVNSLVIHLLNNQELLCSTRVKMVVGKLECTC